MTDKNRRDQKRYCEGNEMSLSIRVYINEKAVAPFYKNRAITCDDLGRYYVQSGNNPLILNGGLFQCGIANEHVDLVTAQGYFHGSKAQKAPERITCGGTGTFRFKTSTVIIARNDSPNGWNIFIESPSLIEFNNVLVALRNGQLRPNGQERPVLEIFQQRLKETEAREAYFRKVYEDVCLRLTGSLPDTYEEGGKTEHLIFSRLNEAIEGAKELANIKETPWFKFRTTIKNFFDPIGS
jgi:hypothetical protein